MDLHVHNSPTINSERMRETGKKMLKVIGLIQMISNLTLVTSSGALFVLSIFISIDLINGVNWIRWLCVFGGIFNDIITATRLVELLDQEAPFWTMILLVLLLIIHVSSLFILATNKNINEYIYTQKARSRIISR